MRIMIKYFSGLALLLLFFACKKEKSIENGESEPPVEGKWEFKESALAYQGPMDSAYILNYGPYQELVLIGNSPDVKGELVLRVPAIEIAIGEYKNPAVLFQYLEDGVLLLQNNPEIADEFSLTITSLDSISVSGTFSGKIIDGLGNAKTLTDGKFTALFTQVEQPDPIMLGQLSIWSKEVCPGEGIKITIDDIDAGFITQAVASEPACGAEGTASIPLPVGEYAIKASCGNNTKTYTVTLTENNCTSLEIDFGAPQLVFNDYFPLSNEQISWTYWNSIDVNITGTTTSLGTEQINGKEYYKFTDLLGKTRYYRKEGNDYYEYADLNFNNPGASSPIEYIFLKDNAAAGTSWETPSVYYPAGQGIGFYARLKFTIVDRDFSREIGDNI